MTLYILKMVSNGYYGKEVTWVISVYDSEEKANIQGDLEMRQVKADIWSFNVEKFILNKVKGGNMTQKPECELLGLDCHVFGIIGRVIQTLKRSGLSSKVEEFKTRAANAKDYNEILRIVDEYVDIV